MRALLLEGRVKTLDDIFTEAAMLYGQPNEHEAHIYRARNLQPSEMAGKSHVFIGGMSQIVSHPKDGRVSKFLYGVVKPELRRETHAEYSHHRASFELVARHDGTCLVLSRDLGYPGENWLALLPVEEVRDWLKKHGGLREES